MKKIISSLLMCFMFVVCGCSNRNEDLESRVYEHYKGEIKCSKCVLAKDFRGYLILKEYGITGVSSNRKMGDIWEVTLDAKCPEHGEFQRVIECSYRNNKLKIVRAVK